MAKFTNCLQIVNAMPEQDQEALLARLDELQGQGLSPKEAQLQAAIDVLAQVEQAADPQSGADAPNIIASPRRKPAPKKTVTAYKLFRVYAKKPGQLFPLFVDPNTPVPIGVWLDADEGEPAGATKTGKPQVKSKLGPLAYRPGWHAGDVPIATHIGGEPAVRFDEESGKNKQLPTIRKGDEVWAEVEMAADVDWQSEANRRAIPYKTNNPDTGAVKGQPNPGTAAITDGIPVDGFYRYKTNPNMTGNWLIGGSMKVNRILSDEEVKAINDAAGVADLPRKEPFDAKKYGFDIRKSASRVTDTPAFKRWFGDSQVVDENGEPRVMYHGTTGEIDVVTGDVFWVTPIKELAATLNGGKRKVEAVYVKASSIFDPSNKDHLNRVAPALDKMLQRTSLANGRWKQAIQWSWSLWDSAKARQAIADAGFDAIKSEEDGNPTLALIGDVEGRVKSATGNNGDFNPDEPSIFKSVDRPQFYSQLQRAIEQVPERLANMAAPAWKQWLTANAPKLGVKAEEVEWSGIKDYLDLQGKAKLSKDDLSAYLDESGVKIAEVMLGGVKDFGAMTDAQLAAEYERIRGYKPESYGEPMSREEIIDELEGAMEDDRAETKYGKYTLPGGENYRELLITLPSKNSVAGISPAQAARVLFKKEYSQLTEEQQQEVMRRISEDASTPAYMSSHWSDPNVLAHIRINDRTDSDGNKVLFVEEIQSDWSQEATKKRRNEIKRLVEDGMSKEQAQKSVPMDFGFDGNTPKAPFVANTEGWLNLALKRIAMMAVEEGYDKVAFVNGEQSADRYDLSKQLSRVGYREGRLQGYDNSGALVMSKSVAPGELPEYVGKELGERMAANAKKDAEVRSALRKAIKEDRPESEVDALRDQLNAIPDEYSGLDLKVGGEGMKTFYDKIVPQAVNKLLPKLGGEKLGTVAMGTAAKYRAIQADADGGGEVVTADGETVSFHDTAEEARAEARRLNGGVLGSTALEQPGFDVTDKMRETVGAGVPLFSRDRTQTTEFKAWFGDSKVVDSDGNPLVVYHGTSNDFSEFKKRGIRPNFTSPQKHLGFFFTDDAKYAGQYAGRGFDDEDATIMPVYLSIQNPKYEPISLIDEIEDKWGQQKARLYVEKLRLQGYDGIIFEGNTKIGSVREIVAFKPTQIKSATGNSGQFDPKNPDIRKSADRKPWFGDLDKLKVSTNYQLGDLLKSSKKLNWWNRTVGTQYNLAQKNPEFKRVFDAVQTFINDVSAYATQAADLAPNILPKLDGIKDVLKKPLSAEDVKALRDPVFGGTLKYMRDENGEIVETDDVQAAGVVFTDEELRNMFGLSDRQIGLYREFRQATDRSLTDLALSDMIRYISEDGVDIREAVMASSNVDVGSGIIESHLEQLADESPNRAESLNATIEAIRQKAEQANRLMDRGYAPLSRFGQYTVYAVGKNGEQLYFGMFETQRDANKMAREMADQYPDAEITTGTMSQESYKLFSGVTPETLALFGESLGLEENGIDPRSEAFQQYLKLAKTNRSAMKRLIERKGIDGFSEDAGRVLAGFVYSNARQVSTNLHAGEISRSASEIKDGDVKDHAIRLMEYIQNPTEEAQKLKALLFTTFLGGNISSAIVNFTQTATTTFPYLSQFDGTGSVMKRLGDAVKLAARGIRNDDELKQALKRAEDEGVVSPQEVFHLMAQAQGRAQLQTGDGTRVGDALAKTNNFMTKATLAWGRLFSAAEQANRRIAFIAAYKLARDKGMADPFGFAEKAVLETQFSTNKGIRPAWARGAVGGVLFTFKGFTISYLELLGRMLGNGPEGKKAFGLALGTLFLFAGAGGMPFVDDLDDVVDGFAQRVLGKSFDSKQAKKEFFASIFGQTGAEFVMGGITSLPGAPIDLSGRLGLGNIVPGTGIMPKKASYQRDAMEIFGPAGSLFSNYAMAVGMLAQGELGSAAAQAAPLGIQNLIKGMDMAQMGFYRDTKGRKVIDTNGWEAAAKALGFQPSSVKRIQDATVTQQGLIAQNKLRETEIADKMARARIERKPELAQEAREELAEWNRKNPESPIRIDQSQINRRVQQAMMDKAKRIEKTAPKEIRQSVARELERAN